MTIKLALCVESADLPTGWQNAGDRPQTQLIPDGFWGIQNRTVDRAICETDPSTQQLLPYNVLVDELGRIFTYSRGKGGAEARLHAKLSVGIGGHVDDVPPEGCGLLRWLQIEAAREIAEEAKVEVFPSDIEFQRLLVDKGSEVGAVHLGLLSIVRVKSSEVVGSEAGIIDGSGWKTMDELADVADRLEPWSGLALAHLELIHFATVGELAEQLG